MKKFKNNIFDLLNFILYVCVAVIFLIFIKEVALGHYFSGMNFNNSLFNIEYAKNSGAAFGLLKEQSAFLCGIASFVLCFIFYYIYIKGKKFSNLEKFSLILISSGIISNTWERLQTGAVIDYINLQIINFPIFNCADLFICSGIILLLLVLFFKKGN